MRWGSLSPVGPALIDRKKIPDPLKRYAEVFLLALRNVAEAQGGVAKLADKANLNRENLYRMLSERGNPELQSLDAILHALGFPLAIELEKDTASAKA